MTLTHNNTNNWADSSRDEARHNGLTAFGQKVAREMNRLGMQDVSALPNITYELLRRGYSEKDIRKVLGENFIRVFSEAERVAQSTRSTISGEGNVRRIETRPGG